MGKFKTVCPKCGHKSEIRVNGISELPKTVVCIECGQAHVKEKLPIK